MKSPKRILLLGLALVAGNALLALRFLPEPTPAEVKVEAAAEWSLPAPPEQAPLDAAYATIRARHPWGPEQPPEQQRRGRKRQSAATEQKPAWRFAGVVYEGDTPYMLVEQDTRLQRYAVGEGLPDEARVVSIGPDRVELEKSDGRDTMNLYR